MKLNQLFELSSDQNIANIMVDSRQPAQEALFFCLEGLSVDGHDFVEQAIAHGAVAIVHRQPISVLDSIITIQVDDVKKTLQKTLDIFYDHPSEKMHLHGITGTNGKSTIMKTLYNLYKSLGAKAGYIGTISIEYDTIQTAPSLTTPDSLELYEILADMVQHDVQEVCLEASSQGLDLGRLEGIHFKSVGFTNLSRDHFDYHQDFESYFLSKHRLFEQLDPETLIILNADDAYGQRLIEEFKERAITYSIQKPADYYAQDIQVLADKTIFTLIHQEEKYTIASPLLARFNVANLLYIIALLHEEGYPLELLAEKIKELPPVEGRLVLVDEGQGFPVLVDYGHAPDSMEQVYQFAKTLATGRLITVFGSAGGRDQAKRPLMGASADRYCDVILLTEDDPRDEAVATICEAIATGIKKTPYEVILNRQEAIQTAIMMAEANDVVVIVGKGQETYMYRQGGQREAWLGDDVIAREALKMKEKD